MALAHSSSVIYQNSTAATSHAAVASITVPNGAIAVIAIAIPTGKVNSITNNTGGATWTKIADRQASTTIETQMWFWKNTSGASVTTTRTIALSASAKIATVTTVLTGVNPGIGYISTQEAESATTSARGVSKNYAANSWVLSSMGAAGVPTFTNGTGSSYISGAQATSTTASSGGGAATNTRIGLVKTTTSPSTAQAYNANVGTLSAAAFWAVVTVEILDDAVTIPANVWTTFDEYPVTTNVINTLNIKQRYDLSTTSVFSIVDMGSGDKAARNVITTASNERMASWGQQETLLYHYGATAFNEVEMLAKVKTNNVTGYQGSLNVRGTGATSSVQRDLQFQINGQSLNVWEYMSSSSFNSLHNTGPNSGTTNAPAFSYTVNDHVWMRVRANGTAWYFKAWIDGQAEPSNWNMTSADSGRRVTQVTSGDWHMFGGYSANSTKDYSYMSIAVNGTTAPSPQVAPTIVPDTPDANNFGTDTTPTVEFTGSDGNNDDLRYNVQIDNVTPIRTVYSSYDESNRSASQSVSGGTTITHVAQSFNSGAGGPLSLAKFMLAKNGAPTGNVIAYLHTHSGTFGTSSGTTGTALATSDPVSITSLTSTHTMTSFTFPTPFTLASNTNYSIVIGFTGGDNAGNNLQVGTDNTSPTHPGNSATGGNPSSGLTFQTADVIFEVSNGSPLVDVVSGTHAGFLNTVNGADTDPFTAEQKISYTVQTPLTAGTYYWRARVTDPAGLNTYSSWTTTRSFTISSGSVAPTVTTSAATNIATTSATGNGDVTSDGGGTITERGFVVATTANPTTADTKFVVSGTTGVFSGSMTGLTSNQLYNYRAYAINSSGTSYGSNTTFTTLSASTPPTLGTASVTANKAIYLTATASISSTGSANATVRGFVYMTGTSGDPTTANSVASESGSFGTGSYTLNITGLTGNTTYRVRPYATNTGGTSYGTTIQVTTKRAVTTIEDLDNIRNANVVSGVIRGDFVITRDLDFNNAAHYANSANMSTYTTGAGFNPLGRISPEPWFGANLDGDGHTISNLMVNDSTTGISNAGLIGVADECIVENLGLINPQINANATNTAMAQVGALIMGIDPVGTVVVRKCFVRGGKVVGGVSTGNNGTGGLIGIAHQYSSGKVDITDCYTEDVNIIRNSSGGGTKPGVGGLVGMLTYISGNGTPGSYLNITNCYAASPVTSSSSSQRGGLVGGIEASVVNTTASSYWDTDISGQSTSASGTGKTTTEMYTQSTYTSWSIAPYATHTTETWYINATLDYPRLYYEPKALALTGLKRVLIGGTWTRKPVKTYNGSTWAAKPVKTKVSGSWTLSV